MDDPGLYRLFRTARATLMPDFQGTPNELVDVLYEADFDSEDEIALIMKVALVAGVIECQDLLDEPHQNMLLTIAELAYQRGQECLCS